MSTVAVGVAPHISFKCIMSSLKGRRAIHFTVLCNTKKANKKTLKPDINNEHVLHTFKIISRMSLVPDSRSVPRRQPVPVSLRLTLDPTHPVT